MNHFEWVIRSNLNHLERGLRIPEAMQMFISDGDNHLVENSVNWDHRCIRSIIEGTVQVPKPP